MPINYKNYHPLWKSVIRPDILKRANDCCEGEGCGVKNGSLIYRHGKGVGDWWYWPEGMESETWTLDGFKSTKIVLTIAHLDHDKTNNDYSNLKALCQKCHLGHDLKNHMANARDTRIKKKKLQSLF